MVILIEQLGGIGHWVLINFYPHAERISTFDSLGDTHFSARERVLHDLGRYTQFRNLEWSPQSWLLQDTTSRCPEQQNNVDCGVFLTWISERLSRCRPNELVGCIDGYLCQCEELLGSDLLNVEAWEILEHVKDNNTHPPPSRTEEPSVLELEYVTFIAKLNEPCEDFAEYVSADPIPDTSVGDHNLRF
ncbi:hypothetical protein J6590_049714 [Homalodisca vitripennis]|nr:hypothetical protein J6590_049714 [Homalodisca vitripennis]